MGLRRNQELAVAVQPLLDFCRIVKTEIWGPTSDGQFQGRLDADSADGHRSPNCPTAGANFASTCYLPLSYSLIFFYSFHEFRISLQTITAWCFYETLFSKNMFSFYTLFTTPLLVLNYMASAPYIQKQLSQIVIESIKPWNQACTNAGGGIKCNDLAMSAYMTLSSIPNQAACTQQHIADDMIDFSKTLENLDMIRLAQLFVQQPLPTIHGLPLPYCQEQPRNIELQGLYSCHFEGSILNLKTRAREHECHHSAHNGNVHVPSPRGSCPALARPLPNGYLLHALTSNPFGASSPESPK